MPLPTEAYLTKQLWATQTVAYPLSYNKVEDFKHQRFVIFHLLYFFLHTYPCATIVSKRDYICLTYAGRSSLSAAPAHASGPNGCLSRPKPYGQFLSHRKPK